MLEGYGSIGLGMTSWWFFGLVVILVIIWVIVKTMIKKHNLKRMGTTTTIEILEEQYGIGKIDKDEFKKRKIFLEKTEIVIEVETKQIES